MARSSSLGERVGLAGDARSHRGNFRHRLRRGWPGHGGEFVAQPGVGAGIRGQRLVGLFGLEGVQGFQDERGEVARLESAAGVHEHEFLVRPDGDALAAAAHGFEQAGKFSAHPPVVAVAVLAAGALDVRAGGDAKPVFGNNLAVGPASALEEKLAEPGHVARVQLEIAPAEVVALRVGGPGGVANAERLEEFATREGKGIGAGNAREKGGQEMAVGVAIEEACARIGSHREIERELRPVIAPAHLRELPVCIDGGSAERHAAVPARLHGKEMFERLLALACVESGDGAVRKEAEHRLLHVANVAALNRQPDER